MIIPFIPEDLFELNNNLQPQFDGKVIIIDDIFKNYKDILHICNNTPVEQWKSSHNSLNFADYYDCRLTYLNPYPDNNKAKNRLNLLSSLINSYYSNNQNISSDYSFYFNYFKNKKHNFPNHFQFYPHIDQAFNVIFYLDKQSNGGTAIYKNPPPLNLEQNYLFYDISKFSIDYIIPSVPNRCVIFPGNLCHGGYIEDHNIYYDDWRINLVTFFKLE